MKFIQWILVGILVLLPTMAAAPATKAQNTPGADLFLLMATDPGQQRPIVEANTKAAQAAQEIADSARDRGTCNFEESPRSPNEILIATGYVVNYGAGNFVASIGCGWSSASDAWSGLRGPHPLGEGDFWVTQTQVGVGYSEGGQFGFVWVILSAPSEPPFKSYLPTMFN